MANNEKAEEARAAEEAVKEAQQQQQIAFDVWVGDGSEETMDALYAAIEETRKATAKSRGLHGGSQ